MSVNDLAGFTVLSGNTCIFFKCMEEKAKGKSCRTALGSWKLGWNVRFKELRCLGSSCKATKASKEPRPSEALEETAHPSPVWNLQNGLLARSHQARQGAQCHLLVAVTKGACCVEISSCWGRADAGRVLLPARPCLCWLVEGDVPGDCKFSHLERLSSWVSGQRISLVL